MSEPIKPPFRLTYFITLITIESEHTYLVHYGADALPRIYGNDRFRLIYRVNSLKSVNNDK